jgi:membrane associated rhomboid family serine protease
MLASTEWWRAVTALTLHGDVVHLVSNLVSGIGFALFVARFFGAACGWCLILLAGALGNALNAWIHYPDPHFSIGASTAVFGALGIITGIGIWAALVQPKERWTMPSWLLPAFGGLTLLGLLGVGDGLTERIDVAAHISGFFCGAWIGLLGAFRQSLFLRLQRFRLWIGAIPVAVVALSWVIALAR